MKVIHQLIDYFVQRGELSAEEVNRLKDKGYWAPPAPYDVRALEAQIGAKFYFLVTGEVDGPLWGTDVYTSDSSIGKAAVHAGLLQAGESAILQVTIEQPLSHYDPSTRNGVSSSSWDYWPGAYTLARLT